MVQKKLPSINSAHGSETRNIINEIIKAINDRGLEILSESGFLTWLDENGIKHRSEVATFSDLPSNDSLNTVRGVEEDNKIYIKKENGWIPFQTIDISKINLVEEKINLRSDSEYINMKFPPAPFLGAVGDGVFDDAERIQNIINFAETVNTKIYAPSGTYLISKPLEVKNRTTLEGAGKDNTIFKKNSSTSLNNQDCLFYINAKRDWRISDFSIIGNRKNKSEGNTVTTNGIYNRLGNYFTIERITVSECFNAVIGDTVWIGKLTQIIAKRCQDYAFKLFGGSTSMVYDNCTSWGCGGAYDITSSIYITILNPANDENNGGGRPNDPFLPQGAGGNYKERMYLFKLSGSTVSIISPGAENNFTAYLYSEGSHITIDNPYIYNLENHAVNADSWSFIETRGMFSSNVVITNPVFHNVKNMVNSTQTARGIYIENPNTQKVMLNKFLPFDDSFGIFKYPKKGVEFQYKNTLIRLEDAINEGYYHIINDGVYENGKISPSFNNLGKRVLKINKGESSVPADQPLKNTFRIPLNNKRSPSIIKLRIKGTYSGSGLAKLSITKSPSINSAGEDIKVIEVDLGLIDVTEYLELPNTNENYFFDVHINFGDVQVTLEELTIDEIL